MRFRKAKPEKTQEEAQREWEEYTERQRRHYDICARCGQQRIRHNVGEPHIDVCGDVCGLFLEPHTCTPETDSHGHRACSVCRKVAE